MTDWNSPTQHASGEVGYVIYNRPWGERRLSILSPRLPTPHIRPRPRRPQSVHVVSVPAGYLPPEPKPAEISRPKKPSRSKRRNKRKTETQTESGPASESTRGVFEKVLSSFKAHLSQQTTSEDPVSPGGLSIPESDQPSSRPNSMVIPPTAGLAPASESATMADIRRAPMLNTALVNSHRNSIMSLRSPSKTAMSSVTEFPKPVASGSGVSCSIILAEPNIFLTGFDHDGHPRHDSGNSTSLLRGKLQLNVTKNVKLKSVTLKLIGRARTEWPEGIPPLKVDQSEETSLRTQVLTFFHAMHESWETEYGNQCSYSLRSGTESPIGQQGTGSNPTTVSLAPRSRPSNLTARDYKRLSLQSVQSRSFGKGDSPNVSVVQQKTYKVFYPGTYEYSFELPIDHHQLETTKLQFGSVKWELETTIERAGAFKPNLHGTKEVRIVRVPDQMSLELTEPISISRQWEDQLHYDIIISGKSFPVGSKVPIAFKLTPLAKVQVHKVKVFVSENIEYWTNDRRVTRKDPGRKILLLEKAAGKPLDPRYESSDVRVLSGGELSPEDRRDARVAAQKRRGMEALQRGSAPVPLPEPTENLLGDLDLGLEAYWGSTEMEMNVQLPTCEQMAKDKGIRLHPDCSWRNINVYHWIKIVMRISRLDPDDAGGKRRRHFEISIDSPFTILDCHATQANTALPMYSGMDEPMYRQHAKCGCHDAEILATNPSPASSTGTIPSVEPSPGNGPRVDSIGLTIPQAAHVQPHPTSSSQPVQRPSATHPQPQERPRPMHLMRYPSFNPPAFDEDEPPPPMPTPPPQYDIVVGTPSVDGLADYFARLADYDDPDSDSGDDDIGTPNRLMERTGRVNVPHPQTPGGRNVPSRSFEIQRPAVPVPLTMTGALQQRRA